jgi:hypothetical protein
MLFLAAFLTQTVTLDNQTTVKFEIWCALVLIPFRFHVLHLNRDTAGQERYKASLSQLTLIMRLTCYSLSYVLAIVFATPLSFVAVGPHVLQERQLCSGSL